MPWKSGKQCFYHYAKYLDLLIISRTKDSDICMFMLQATEMCDLLETYMQCIENASKNTSSDVSSKPMSC